MGHSRPLVKASIEGVQKVAIVGQNILNIGGSAIDVVEAAITILEDDPTFDAGTGSVLTSSGTVEMDAIIMDGSNLKLGAVASVENIKNSIILARLVMEKTNHTMLMGQGATEFAREMGMEIVPTSTLVTSGARDELELLKMYNKCDQTNFSERPNYAHDTIGCVALDRYGLFSAGTSSGGITGKRPGRVGDSPLAGCGAYSDNTEGATSCTGHGESITKCCLARRIVEGCGKNESAKEAIENGLTFMRTRMGKAGGGICIDKNGVPEIGFNSERMAWTIIFKGGINPNETIQF